MTVVAIDRVKQKSLESIRIITVKMIDQSTQIEIQVIQSKDQVVIFVID